MYSVNINIRPLQECQHEFALCESCFWCATIFNNSIKERLFEKFVTSSSKGTGLGLYLSRKIIEAHDGQLWIDYDDNNDNNSGVIRRRTGDKGSRFVFSIPMSKKKKSSNNDN